MPCRPCRPRPAEVRRQRTKQARPQDSPLHASQTRRPPRSAIRPPPPEREVCRSRRVLVVCRKSDLDIEAVLAEGGVDLAAEPVADFPLQQVQAEAVVQRLLDRRAVLFAPAKREIIAIHR